MSSFCLISSGFRCKWSNEGCDSDSECCSKKCELPHPGTNPRCTKSPLYGPCIFHYQCQDRLECSRKRYQCCSPYWGTCMNRTDCCNTRHLCVPAEGFIYKRCLFQEVSSSPETTEVSWAMTGMGVLLSQLISFFSLNGTFACNITWPPKPSR